MIVNKEISCAIAFLLGGSTSLLYLGLLWLCVKKFTEGAQKMPIAILGFFFRLALIGSFLYLMAKWLQMEGVLFYLLGFFIVKKIAQKKKLYGYHS